MEKCQTLSTGTTNGLGIGKLQTTRIAMIATRMVISMIVCIREDAVC
jgi:hypothetical protein